MPADEKGHLYIVHVHSVLHFVDKEFIRIHGQFAYMSGLLQKLPCSVLRFPLPVFGAYFKYYLKEENVLSLLLPWVFRVVLGGTRYRSTECEFEYRFLK